MKNIQLAISQSINTKKGRQLWNIKKKKNFLPHRAMGIECHFQQYFSFIMAVSFMICHKSMPRLITLSLIDYTSPCKGLSWSWSYGCEFESHPDGVYSIQHYVIKFVSHLRQVSGLLWVIRFPPPIKLTATI
jgi:hypothetical protein